MACVRTGFGPLLLVFTILLHDCFGANRILPSSQCGSPKPCADVSHACSSPIDVFVNGTTARPSPFSAIGSSDVLELAFPNVSSDWLDSDAMPAGVYSLNYSTRDVCGRSSPTTASLVIACNNAPIIHVNNVSASIARGAEVLLDARRSLDPDPSDNHRLEYYWCVLSQPDADAEATLRVPQFISGKWGEGVALLRPVTAGVHTVRVWATDGCNWPYVDTIVDVNVTQPNVRVSIVSGSEGVVPFTHNDADTALSITTVGSQSCLPPAYPGALYGGKCKGAASASLSPVMMSPLGAVLPVSLADLFPNDTIPTHGCTWPAALNFNELATYEDCSCRCAALNISWSFVPASNSSESPFSPSSPEPLLYVVSPDPDTVHVMESIAVEESIVTDSNRSWLSTPTFMPLTADIRLLQHLLAGVPLYNRPVLGRPSTSWDAVLHFDLIHSSLLLFSSSNDTAVVLGQDAVICTASLAPRSSSTSAFAFAYNTSLRQGSCTGRFQVSASAIAPYSAIRSEDSVGVDVACPDPPLVSILCDVSMIWTGLGFTGIITVSGDGKSVLSPWVVIDGRDTPTHSSFGTPYSFSLTVSQEPAVLAYPGANNTGPFPGTVDLSPLAITVVNFSDPSNHTGLQLYFLPTRGGTYAVTLSVSDDCSPIPMSDTVSVVTRCLNLTCTASVGDLVQATTTSPASVSLTAFGTTTGPSSSLNWAFRVLSRPQLPMGDIVLYPLPPPNTSVGYECLLGDGWSIGSLNSKGAWPAVNMLFGDYGNYTIEVTVLDGCAAVHKTLPVVSVDCGTVVDPVFPGVTENVTFSNGSFSAPYLSGPGGSLASAVTYAWFLSDGPAEHVYPIPYNRALSLRWPTYYRPVMCSPYAPLFSCGGSASLRPVDSRDPFSPLFVSTTPSPPLHLFTPTAVGPYTVTLLVIGTCSSQTASTTFDAVPNGNPQFVCADGSTCSGPSFYNITVSANNFNGLSSRNFGWDCGNQRFSTVFVGMLGTGGTDSYSAHDTLTYTVSFLQAPAGSWWGVGAIVATVQCLLTIAHTNSSQEFIVMDSNGNFGELGALVEDVFQSAAATSLSVDPTRVAISLSSLRAQQSLTAGVDLTGLPPLGASLSPQSDLIAGFGRTFNLSVTFAITPPPYFSSYGAVVSPLHGNSEATGYFHNFPPSADGRPLSVTLSTLSTQAQHVMLSLLCDGMSALFNDSTLGLPGCLTIVNGTLPVLFTVPSPILYRATVTTNLAAGINSVLSTSFTPDVYGNYTLSVTLADDCPGTVDDVLLYAVSPRPQACFFNDFATLYVNVTSGSAVTAANGTFSRLWLSRAQGFGLPWTYGGGFLPNPTVTPLLFTYQYIPLGTTPFNLTCFQTLTCGSSFDGSFTFDLTCTQPCAALFEFYAGFVTAGAGATLQFDISGGNATFVSPGSELRVGCAAHTLFPYADPASPAISYFGFVDTSTEYATLSLTIPVSCTRSVVGFDIYLFQLGGGSGNRAVPWFLDFVTIIVHPIGLPEASPDCVFQYAWEDTSGTSAMFPITNVSTMALLSQYGVSAPAVIQQPVSNARIVFSVSEYRPAWSLPVGSQPCTVSSGAHTNVSLVCPKYSLAWLPYLPPAFNHSGFHFDVVELELQVKPSPGSPPLYYPDLSFSFTVVSAPPNSLLNATYAATTALLSALASQFGPTVTSVNVSTGSPQWVFVSEAAGSPVAIEYLTPSSVATSNVGGTVTSFEAVYVNLSTLVVQLGSKLANPGVDPAAVYPAHGSRLLKARTLQSPQLFTVMESMATAFQPDVSGTYIVSASVLDGCNVGTESSITTHVRVSPCVGPVVTIGDGSGVILATIPPSGPTRVMLSGSINGLSRVSDVVPRVRSVRWSAVRWPGPSMPSIANSDDLLASFIPSVATVGTEDVYEFMLVVDSGCTPPDPASIGKVVVIVSCGAPQPSPVPIVVFGSAGNFSLASDVYQTANDTPVAPMWTLLYAPHALGGMTIDWLAQPGCVGYPLSSWASPLSVQYTNTTVVLSVTVVSVFPGTLLPTSPCAGIGDAFAPPGQPVLITIAVGGSVGIPPGVFLQRNGSVPMSDFSVSIGGTSCASPTVISYRSGLLMCRVVAGLSCSSSALPVVVCMHGICSSFVNGNGAVGVGYPTVGKVLFGNNNSVPSCNTCGEVTLFGTNLVFHPSFSWSWQGTAVFVNGSPCTNVTALPFSSITSSGALSCVFPSGYGLATVTAVLSFGSNPVPSVPFSLFQYASPNVISISPSSGRTLGVQWVNVTVGNVGSPSTSIRRTLARHADDVYPGLTINFGGTTLTSAHVLVIDTLFTANTTLSCDGMLVVLSVLTPPGCGAAVPVLAYRGQSGPAEVSGPKFRYEEPFVIGVSSPVVDAASSACARVMIDGTNFGSNASGSTVTFLLEPFTQSLCGACDEVAIVRNHTRLSCRLNNAILPGCIVKVTNACGQYNAAQLLSGQQSVLVASPSYSPRVEPSRNATNSSSGHSTALVSSSSSSSPSPSPSLSGLLGQPPVAMPLSVYIQGCPARAFLVESPQPYSFALQPPYAPETVIDRPLTTEIFSSFGSWSPQGINIRLFFPVFLFLLFLVLVCGHSFLTRRPAAEVEEALETDEPDAATGDVYEGKGSGDHAPPE